MCVCVRLVRVTKKPACTKVSLQSLRPACSKVRVRSMCLKRSLHGPQDGDKTYNCCSGAVFMGTGCVARWRSDVEIHDHEHDHLRSRGGRHERHNESGRDQHKTTRGHQIRSEMTLLYPWVQVLWTLTSTFLNTTRPNFGRSAVSRKAKCWSQVLSRERDRVRTIDCFLYVVGYTVN